MSRPIAKLSPQHAVCVPPSHERFVPSVVRRHVAPQADALFVPAAERCDAVAERAIVHHAVLERHGSVADGDRNCLRWIARRLVRASHVKLLDEFAELYVL